MNNKKAWFLCVSQGTTIMVFFLFIVIECYRSIYQWKNTMQGCCIGDNRLALPLSSSVTTLLYCYYINPHPYSSLVLIHLILNLRSQVEGQMPHSIHMILYHNGQLLAQLKNSVRRQGSSFSKRIEITKSKGQ